MGESGPEIQITPPVPEASNEKAFAEFVEETVKSVPGGQLSFAGLSVMGEASDSPEGQQQGVIWVSAGKERKILVGPIGNMKELAIDRKRGEGHAAMRTGATSVLGHLVDPERNDPQYTFYVDFNIGNDWGPTGAKLMPGLVRPGDESNVDGWKIEKFTPPASASQMNN